MGISAMTTSGDARWVAKVRSTASEVIHVCTANVSRLTIPSAPVTMFIASRILIAARVTVGWNSGRFGGGVGMDR